MIFKQQNFQKFLSRTIYDLLNDYPKYFKFSNIKFILNIQANNPDTKHIKQILVILFQSLSEI